MIAYLRGKTTSSFGNKVVIDVNGVGYEVAVTNGFKEELIADESEVVLYVEAIYREDSQTLYGFPTKSQKQIFSFLIGLSKVGASLALNIMDVFSPSELLSIVAAQDVVSLCRVSGIGNKSSERILLEAKGKISSLTEIVDEQEGTQETRVNSATSGEMTSPTRWAEMLRDVEMGLMALGYDTREIQNTLNWVRAEFVSRGNTNEELSADEMLTYAVRRMGS